MTQATRVRVVVRHGPGRRDDAGGEGGRGKRAGTPPRDTQARHVRHMVPDAQVRAAAATALTTTTTAAVNAWAEILPGGGADPSEAPAACTVWMTPLVLLLPPLPLAGGCSSPSASGGARTLLTSAADAAPAQGGSGSWLLDSTGRAAASWEEATSLDPLSRRRCLLEGLRGGCGCAAPPPRLGFRSRCAHWLNTQAGR